MPQADRLASSTVPTLRLKAERRIRPRYKVQTPAYATTNRNSGYILPHLSEIVDISESGLCFQNPSQLEPDEGLELSLDLSETKAHISALATVVWSEPSGRTGLRFDRMSDESLHQLREWLFANILVACANHVSFAGSLEALLPLPESHSHPEERPTEPDVPLVPDHTSILAAIAAIQKEVEALGVDTDAALRLVTHRALTLTRASGAALALSGGESMICRASSGPDAPEVGALLQIGQGFSGECVRAGELLHCEDSETDPRVDREGCRALGVRCMIAAPIRADGAVAGLLEVFAQPAHAFSATDRLAVQNLAQIASRAVERGIHALATQYLDAGEHEVSTAGVEGDLESRRSSRIKRILIAAIVLASLVLLGLLVIPRLAKSGSLGRAPAKSPSSQPAQQTVAGGFEGIKQRAERGDADAQYALGLHYAIGDPVRLDQVEAARWFAAAAEQGYVRAQSTMATHYWTGTGVPKGARQAYFWALLARANGDETGKVLVPELEGAMTQSEILDVRQQANDWLRHHQLSSPSQ